MWYSAKIIYEAIHSKNEKRIENIRTMYEESIYIFKAEDEKKAKQKSFKIAKAQEQSYQNNRKELVNWKLFKVLEIQEIGNTIKDGIEISSRHFKNITAYKKFDPLVK